jgi:hypothetical protein
MIKIFEKRLIWPVSKLKNQNIPRRLHIAGRANANFLAILDRLKSPKNANISALILRSIARNS